MHLVAEAWPPKLSQPSSFSLPFEQSQDVTFAYGTFDVSDDGTSGLIHELDAYLSYVTGVTGSSKHFLHFGELDRLRIL